jgi:hypothetical protein
MLMEKKVNLSLLPGNPSKVKMSRSHQNGCARSGKPVWIPSQAPIPPCG